MSRKISDYFSANPKNGEKVANKFNIQEENSILPKIRECHVIIDDIKDQFINKLKMFGEISLNNSQNSEVKVNRFCCKFCKKEFSFGTNLTAHIKRAHSSEIKIFNCIFCNWKFFQKRFLEAHMKNKHQDEQFDQFECDFDGKIFKNKEYLHRHMKAHQSLVKCQICKKMLKPHSINSHLRNLHATDKKFQCKFCSKSFSSAASLYNHEKLHNKAHKCDICNKVYPFASNLNNHKKEVHENSGSFGCEVCDKKFNSKGNLKKHQKIHEKIHPKTFKCQRCDYGTNTKISFVNHQKLHERQDQKIATMKNPLKCEKCAMFCKDKVALYDHMRHVHPKVIFQCDLCAIFIKSKFNLIKHMKNHIKNIQKNNFDC